RRAVGGAVLLLGLAGLGPAQSVNWRRVGNSAVDLRLASPATGPVDKVWFSGAESSQKVTEDYEGSLGPVGNRAIERMSIRELYCETNKSSSCESRFK